MLRRGGERPERGETAVRNFVVGLIVGFLILPAGLYIYVRSGNAPVATAYAPMPFERMLARTALHARIAKEAPQKDLKTFTDADLVSGAQVYQTNCAFCHGLPGQPASAASAGMFPRAPQLFTADGTVTDDSVGVTYWKVNNGIRLSGMPGFHAALGEQQMWQVSALVARADNLPPAALDALRPGVVGVAAPAAGAQTIPAAPAGTTPTTPH